MSAHQRYLEAPYEDAAREERAFEHWVENHAQEVYDFLRAAGDLPQVNRDGELVIDGISFDEWTQGIQAEREFEAWMNRRPETPWTFATDAFSEFE